jgi:hypothetical protein
MPQPKNTIEDQIATRSYDKRRFRRSTKFRYDPLETITPYVLARFISMLQSSPIHFVKYFELPEQMRRHFRLTKNG